jgi:hypothetical protein
MMSAAPSLRTAGARLSRSLSRAKGIAAPPLAHQSETYLKARFQGLGTQLDTNAERGTQQRAGLF